MKIVSIFTGKLYAFQYPAETDNEFDRLMELWTDVTYLKQFADKNGIKSSVSFVENRLSDAEQIQDLLDHINEHNEPLQIYFQKLAEPGFKLLSLQKGKTSGNQLRLYAIKIDEDCFVITGGAIKMSQKMKDHPDTAKELQKLTIARNYLNENGVFDEASFYELLNEEDNDK